MFGRRNQYVDTPVNRSQHTVAELPSYPKMDSHSTLRHLKTLICSEHPGLFLWSLAADVLVLLSPRQGHAFLCFSGSDAVPQNSKSLYELIAAVWISLHDLLGPRITCMESAPVSSGLESRGAVPNPSRHD